jgi:hypothetical protein
MKISSLNKRKNIYIGIETFMSMKLNNNKKQGSTFNKKKRKAIESLKLKKMTHCKKFKLNGKKRKKIPMI